MAPTTQQLRGFMAQVARGEQKSLGRVTRFDVNQLLVKAGLDRIQGNEMAPILDELKKGPYPTHGNNKLTAYSFEYWFNYFYKELPLGIGGESKQLEFAVHVINDDGSFRTENQVENKQKIFKDMLDLGFKQFQARDHMTAMAMQFHAAKDNELQRNANILFRGDSRDQSKIKTQGTVPQTQVVSLRQSRGMNNEWHPFRNNGTAVWVRNGVINKDNCLFSAVSVTPQFRVATKFPLLEGLLGEEPAAVGHALVVTRKRPEVTGGTGPALSAFERARQNFAQPAASDEGPKYLLASKTNIYGVLMRGGFNTQLYQGQDTFPEYASDNLEWSDHLVWFSVTRIHFDQFNANNGHLIVINAHRILQDEDAIRGVLLGPRSWPALKAFVSDIVREGTLRDGVGGIVYTPPGVPWPPFEIVKVREPFMPGALPPDAARAATTKLPIPAAFQRG